MESERYCGVLDKENAVILRCKKVKIILKNHKIPIDK